MSSRIPHHSPATCAPTIGWRSTMSSPPSPPSSTALRSRRASAAAGRAWTPRPRPHRCSRRLRRSSAVPSSRRRAVARATPATSPRSYRSRSTASARSARDRTPRTSTCLPRVSDPAARSRSDCWRSCSASPDPAGRLRLTGRSGGLGRRWPARARARVVCRSRPGCGWRAVRSPGAGGVPPWRRCGGQWLLVRGLARRTVVVGLDGVGRPREWAGFRFPARAAPGPGAAAGACLGLGGSGDAAASYVIFGPVWAGLTP